jgi:hypothetical protein
MPQINFVHRLGAVFFTLLAMLLFSSSSSAALTATPSSLKLTVGQKATVAINGASGSLSLSNLNNNLAKAELSGATIKIEANAAGAFSLTVRDKNTSVAVPITVLAQSSGNATAATTASPIYTLLAWNDLGMHCMDGDYSVFAILPPYNNLHAQIVDSSGNKLSGEGLTLTYEAMTDADGSINSISSNKTNFWQYAKALFNADLAPNVGLTGNPTASGSPAPMSFDSATRVFKAEGIPITPYDDAQRKNPYPMVKVVAKDASGKTVAQARVVLPVSDEMSCVTCHGSHSGDAAKPVAGWVNDPHPEKDWKKNILRLHDEKQIAKYKYRNALKIKGYDPAGLFATAEKGTPILCASCHASNALPGTGITGIRALTAVIHTKHAGVTDPTTGKLLNAIGNRSACYQCHPGSETKCLRGVMGTATLTNGKAAINCQGCHGSMGRVGAVKRIGWLQQPNCQACHHDGQRELQAVSAGVLKTWTDTRYATNADTPAAGFSLYRFSKGHGGLQCEACHGATHAEYPSSHANDNVLSKDVQGREGTIGECASCHKTVPLTADKGPHGMHTVGSAWVKGHESSAKAGATACAYCHGADYRGSILSTVKVARSFNADGKTVNFAVGQKVGCYDCHNGPKGN